MKYQKDTDPTTPKKWFIIDIISAGELEKFKVVVSFGLADSSNDTIVLQQLIDVFTGTWDECTNKLNEKVEQKLNQGYLPFPEAEPVQIK